MTAVRSAVLETMGTVVSLAAPDGPDFQAAAEAAFAFLRHVDEVFSPFRPDSAVSMIRDGRLDTRRLDDHPHRGELREVLALCERLRDDSGGTFDAWAVGRPPHFDPCGAVKGWSAERASALLARHGVPRHALNAGGDVRLRAGTRPTAEPWRVGIADPLRPGCLIGSVAAHDGAVATSGTSERGAHIWTVASGRPAEALSQVTVVGPDLALADGYATAAMAHATATEAHAWLAGPVTRRGFRAVVVDRDGTVSTTGGLVLTRAPAATVPAGEGG